jgi:hypothetical protein
LHHESEVKYFFTKIESCITVRVTGFNFEYHHLILYSDVIEFLFFLKILGTRNVNTLCGQKAELVAVKQALRREKITVFFNLKLGQLF